MFIFTILMEILCRQCLKSATHGHHQRLGFLCDALLQLTSVVVCLRVFLPLVLSSIWVEIRRLTWPLQNIPLFTFKNSWVAFAVCFVHLYYEAPSNQLCCIWLNLGREYHPSAFIFSSLSNYLLPEEGGGTY